MIFRRIVIVLLFCISFFPLLLSLPSLWRSIFKTYHCLLGLCDIDNILFSTVCVVLFPLCKLSTIHPIPIEIWATSLLNRGDRAIIATHIKKKIPKKYWKIQIWNGRGMYSECRDLISKIHTTLMIYFPENCYIYSEHLCVFDAFFMLCRLLIGIKSRRLLLTRNSYSCSGHRIFHY